MKQFTKITMLLISFFVFLFLIAPTGAFAGDAGTISYAEGRVDLLRQNGETAVSLREGDIVAVGDAVRTKSNSRAEITFNDKSVLRLAQNSKAIVKDYAIDVKFNRVTADVLLERGKARAIVAKTKQQTPFIISTPNAQGHVKGSDIIAFYQGGNSGLLVSEGRLSVISAAHPEKEIAVPAGTTILVSLDEFPREPRPFLEAEKKLHEQDTYIPPSISKREKATEIKGIFTRLSGDVKVTARGADSAHAAKIGDMVGEGDTIETGDKGLVEIKFDNGNGMNLKPNTRIIIVKLVIDPKTGEYENIFESNMGKIRSRIENLKGKSTFEIRTPTAITGARATIMYTEIISAMTKAYFDGGRGYVKSVLSGIEKSIEAGQNSSADANGNVSDVLPTTDEERGSNDEGWDPGNGVDGYSSPENDGGSYFSGDGADSDSGDAGNWMGNNNGVYNDINVPFGTVYGFLVEGLVPATARIGYIYGYFSGKFPEGGYLSNGYQNIHDPYDNSIHWELIDPITGEGINWGGYILELEGNFYNYRGEAAHNIGNQDTEWWLNLVGDAAHDPKDCWMANASGTWSGGHINGELKGVMLNVEDGGVLSAGTINGFVTGDYVEVEGPSYGTWQAISVGEWVEAETLLDTANMEVLNNSIISFINDNIGSVPLTVYSPGVMTGIGTGGITSASMNMNLYGLTSTPIDGIWAALINGNYSGPVSSAWTAAVSNEYSSVNLTGTEWNNNQWAATVSGIVNGNAVNGSASGTYTPPNDSNAGTFTGVGAGTWGPNQN